MANKNPDKNIAVLMGGRSREREISLKSGANVLKSLKRQGLNAFQFDTDEDLIKKLRAKKIDIVYIALHGKYGEDGVIQGVLELHDIPYTGSKVLASALAMNKVAAKRAWQACRIPTPDFRAISPLNPDRDILNIKENFKFPVVVKPVSEGSSLGVSIVKEKEALAKAVKDTVKEYKDVFVESFIPGKEITIGILGTNKLEALPVLELIPKNEFYDYEAKYTEGLTEFILPARLSKAIYRRAQDVACAAHEALGCYGVSRVDMIVGPDNIPYVTEINTIPGMTDRSDLPAQAAHMGMDFDKLVLRILESAR